MKKKLYILYYSIASLVVLYYILNLTGICVLNTIPSSSSEPSIKSGSFILSTNLKTPKRGDFITYKFNTPELGNATWIHRLCGIENDTIQIKEGVLFVNGENFDKHYSLQHAYFLSQAQFDKLKDLSLNNFKIEEDTFMVFMKDSDAKTYALEKHRHIESKKDSDPIIVEKYSQNWNKDHFGPLIIPKGKIFVLGDNRDNSQDSRTTGLVDASAITGVYWMTLFTIN